MTTCVYCGERSGKLFSNHSIHLQRIRVDHCSSTIRRSSATLMVEFAPSATSLGWLLVLIALQLCRDITFLILAMGCRVPYFSATSHRPFLTDITKRRPPGSIAH